MPMNCYSVFMGVCVCLEEGGDIKKMNLCRHFFITRKLPGKYDALV